MRSIDADELKKRLMEMTRFKPNYEIGEPTWGLTRRTSFHMSEIMRVVIDMPTIEERRCGRWELIDDTEFRIPGYRCSACHCECEDWDKKPTYAYCPMCGARMDP